MHQQPLCAKAKVLLTQTPAVLPPGDLECEMKSDSSPERDHAHDDDIAREQEVTDGNKKRKRKPYRPGEEMPRESCDHLSYLSVSPPFFTSPRVPGIGGFMVRQRGGKAGLSRIKLCRKDSTETLQGRDEGGTSHPVGQAPNCG